VAVGRGLWDFTSKDIYDYVDSLQEGKENKVGACACQSLCGLPDQPSYILQLASNATHLLHLKSWYRICSLAKLGKHHGVPS
jgi:cobalamin biosynthesis Mg chelatase CobN